MPINQVLKQNNFSSRFIYYEIDTTFWHYTLAVNLLWYKQIVGLRYLSNKKLTPLFDTSHFSDVNIHNQIFCRIFIRRDPFSAVSWSCPSIPCCWHAYIAEMPGQNDALTASWYNLQDTPAYRGWWYSFAGLYENWSCSI